MKYKTIHTHAEADLALLKKYGFQKFGYWEMMFAGSERDGEAQSAAIMSVAGGSAPVTLERLANEERHSMIYAFLVDGEVRYVGQTEAGIVSRMIQYQKMFAPEKWNAPIGTGTSQRIKGLIVQALKNGSHVEIFTFEPPVRDAYKFGELTIDVCKGLETEFINTLKADWNISQNYHHVSKGMEKS